MQDIVKQLCNGLIVSCQASPGWPFFGPDSMQRMAVAAKQGGAAGIRACWAADIRAVKQAVDIPVVGVNKIIGERMPTAADVIITPTFDAAAEIIEAGCDILGIDCTARGRSYDDVARLLEEIRRHYPAIVIMADISTLEEGVTAAKMGVDIVSTTLSGYTNTSLNLSEEEARGLSKYPEGEEPPPDFDLISALRQAVDIPINAEGRIWEAEQLRQAFACGADMVTVGTAITAPQLITKRFAAAIPKAEREMTHG